MHLTVACMHTIYTLKTVSISFVIFIPLLIFVTISIAPHSYTVTVTVNASTRLLVPSRRRPDVKLWQCLTLMREVQQISTSRDLAVIVCGDFNRLALLGLRVCIAAPERLICQYSPSPCPELSIVLTN